MKIFTKIERLPHLSESEQVLVNFIMNEPKRFTQMKIKEICDTCYVSKSTVYRFCNKLQLDGLTDLKFAISNDMNTYSKTEIELNYDFPINPFQLETEVAENISHLYAATVNNTKNLFDYPTIVAAANDLVDAKGIDIYTSAGNIYFANNFRFQMSEIGIDVHVPIDEYSQDLTAARSNETRIAIIISFGGRGRFLENILRILEKNNTKIILVTSTEKDTWKKKATHTIYMSSLEDHYNKISSFSTRLSLLYILDTLYAVFFQLNYQENIAYKTSTYRKMRIDVK